MKTVRMCILCRKNPASVPDRERYPLKPTPVICSDCHAARLAGDLKRIVRVAADAKGP
jgi:hypothetical protein